MAFFINPNFKSNEKITYPRDGCNLQSIYLFL